MHKAVLGMMLLAGLTWATVLAEETAPPKETPGDNSSNAQPESRAVSWGPKEIKDLEERARKMEPELQKMSPADLKTWLTIDAHGRNSYEQLKMLSIVTKTFTRKEWESIFGLSAIEGQLGIISWVGKNAVGKKGLVEYIVPWTGEVQMLEASHGRKEKNAYALVVP